MGKEHSSSRSRHCPGCGLYTSADLYSHFNLLCFIAQCNFGKHWLITEVDRLCGLPNKAWALLGFTQRSHHRIQWSSVQNKLPVYRLSNAGRKGPK